MDAVLTLLSKVFIIAILMLLGYILSRKGLLTDRGASDITTILIKIVTPCVIIDSFLRSRGSVELIEMVYALGIGVISVLVSIFVGRLGFRNEPPERKTVLHFSVTFSNVGFMGMPLVQGIVGEKGVIYASFGIVVFNLVCWTYGYRMMNSQAKLTARTILLNPGMIGIAIGLPLYFIGADIPILITEPIGMVSALNTPLAMIIIGSYIAKLDFRAFLSDASVYKASALRLLLAPTLFLVIMLLIRPSQDLMVAGMIQAATPVAANSVLFAIQYKKDSLLASKCLAVSTLFSIITIPIFILLVQLQ